MGKILTLRSLMEERIRYREEAKKVVFTNGCFDIIHRGHIEYLTKAKSLGDILIVGINSDDSVRRLKGPLRPIVEEDDRMYVVSNLTPVDYVCLFHEETPFELISALVPDILVKGSDWTIDKIVGKDVVENAGGKVATIDFVPGQSTTSIIERIRERCP